MPYMIQDFRFGVHFVGPGVVDIRLLLHTLYRVISLSNQRGSSYSWPLPTSMLIWGSLLVAGTGHIRLHVRQPLVRASHTPYKMPGASLRLARQRKIPGHFARTFESRAVLFKACEKGADRPF